MSPRSRLALLTLVLVAGCKQQTPTEIVLEIRTDIPVPMEMNRLRLTVSTMQSPDFFDRSYDLMDGQPRRITLVPRSGTPAVTLQVDGFLGTQLVVTRRATVQFVKDQSLLLPIDLQLVCVASRFRGCNAGMTCVAGNCASEQVDASRLPRLTDPSPPPPDAAPASDAAPAPAPDSGGAEGPSPMADGPAVPADAPAPDAPVPDAGPGVDAPLAPDAAADAPLPADAPPLPFDAASKKPLGDPCGTGTECLSGLCIDGYCCNDACQGLCRSCSLPGRQGTCTMFPSGDDPADECGDDGKANCKRDGQCDGMGACRLWAAGTRCLDESCAGATHMLVSTCDGAGTCVSSGSESCSPYLCGPSGTCRRTCASQLECLPPYACVAGVCVSPNENCSNGADDDSDGRIDCADTDCVNAGYLCTAAAPPGWTGPVAFHDGPPAGWSCLAPYPVTSYSGKGALSCPAGTCSPCGCGSPEQVTCQLPQLEWTSGAPCVSFSTPGSTGYTCTDTALPFEAGAVQVSASTATGGRCTPQGGVPALPAATWGTVSLACQASALVQGGCTNAQLCAPRPPQGFEIGLCVHAPGDLACPAGYTGRRRVFHQSLMDGRGCNSCSCDSPAGVTCGGTVAFFADKGCATEPRSVPVPSPECVQVDKANVATIYLPAFTGGSCQRSGGGPTGDCAPQMPTTVCCQ